MSIIMKKSIERIDIEVVGDRIHLSQPDPLGDRDDVISISPDQVIQLIEWLRDARDKIEDARNGTKKG